MQTIIKINVNNLTSNINSLKNNIDNYATTILSFYNILIQTKAYWNDPTTEYFFKDIYPQQQQLKKTFYELNNVLEVYNFIFQKYKNYSKIAVCFNNQEALIDKFNSNLNLIDTTIKKYSNTNAYFDNKIYNYLLNEKNKLSNIYSTLKSIKEDYSSKIKYIKDTEDVVRYKLSQLTIGNITENTINPKVNTNVSSISMDASR